LFLLSQHVRDSLLRVQTLDSLFRLKSGDVELLDSARVSHDSSASVDTVALKAQIQQIQHLYDSLLAAPLAGVVGAGGARQLALKDSKSWSDGDALAARPEDLWLRDEEKTIV